MGILDVPAADFRGKPVAAFDPARDWPEVLLDFDADTVTGTNGTTVATWQDRGPLGQDVWQDSTATRPTLRTATVNGHASLAFTGGQYLARPLANTDRGFGYPNGGFGAPMTFFAVVKTTPGTYTVDRAIVAANTGAAPTPTVGLAIQGASGYGNSPQSSLGVRCAGDDVADGKWHVIAALVDTTAQAVWVDGVLAGSSSASPGANPFGIGLGVGGAPDGTRPFDGEIARVIVCNGRMSHRRIADMSGYLGKRYGLTTTRQTYASRLLDTTSSTGDNLRAWLPRGAAVGQVNTAPVVLWNHPSGQNEQANAGYFLYPLIHAVTNRGWTFVGLRGHGENWGNTAGLADLAAADAYASANLSTGPRILGGGSMGGLLTALGVAGGQVSNLKGAFGVDAVFSLAALFNNNSGSYAANIRTAYGIAADGSDYAAKTAGHDPVLLAASAFGTVPWRFWASSGDTVVNKGANTDAFRALIAGAAKESVVVSKSGGHLSTDGIQPRDFLAFADRCLV